MKLTLDMLKKLGPEAYEYTTKRWYFHVRKEQGEWIGDIFEWNVPGKPHYHSESWPSLEDAVDYIGTW